MKKVKGYTINELTALAQLLSKCKNDKDLKSSTTIISGIRLIKSIQASIKNFFDEQSEIFKALDVSEVEKEGSKYYSWEDKTEDSQKVINAALAELAKTEYPIEYTNKIDEEDFSIYTRGLSNSEVVYLYDFLVIKE
jgi:hypothetical protein